MDFIRVLCRFVVERLAARATRARRQFEHAQLVALAEAGEAQQRVVRVCDPEAIDKVLFLGGRRNLAATTALLRLVLVERHGLAVTQSGRASCRRGVVRYL